ncbi:MAG: PP2C family serine/threonine-protein phosphatase [Polyangia bacterium]
MPEPSAPCAVTYAAVTDVGRRREQNEDAHGEFTLPGGDLLLVVADGMGGHQGGEVASRIAVEALGHIAQHSPAKDPREKLHNGLLVAHQRVVTHAESAGSRGMGTTAVAVYLRGSEAYVAHVGDSRLYHLRDGAISWRTLDHTRVERMVRMGILTPEQAKNHPDANIVTRAIGHNNPDEGATPEPEVQEEPLLLLCGDVIVLCSDGVYDGVTDEEIASIASAQPAQAAAQALVDLANERGGNDNITVTVLRYGERPPSRPPAPARDHRRPAPVEPVAASPSAAAPAPRPHRSRWGVAALVAAVLVAGGIGGWLALRRGPAGGSAGSGASAQDLGAPAVRDLAVRPADLSSSALPAAPTAPDAGTARGAAGAARPARSAVPPPPAAAPSAAPAAAKPVAPAAAPAARKTPPPAAAPHPPRSEGK